MAVGNMMFKLDLCHEIRVIEKHLVDFPATSIDTRFASDRHVSVHRRYTQCSELGPSESAANHGTPWGHRGFRGTHQQVPALFG